MNATVHTFRLGPDREGAPVVQVPLQALRFHPRNIRTNLGDITALAESIRQEGVLVPLMAERRPSGGLQLLHGHRRWAAADLAGLRRVPCMIVPEHSDDEAILLMLAENTGRAAVDPGDLQTAIETLTSAEFRYSISSLAVRLGVPEATIRAWKGGRADVHPTAALAAASAPASSAAARARKRRSDAGRPKPSAPRIRAKDVHALLDRLDSGEIDSAALVGQLRTWLGDWRPVSTGPKT